MELMVDPCHYTKTRAKQKKYRHNDMAGAIIGETFLTNKDDEAECESEPCIKSAKKRNWARLREPNLESDNRCISQVNSLSSLEFDKEIGFIGMNPRCEEEVSSVKEFAKSDV